MKLILTLRNLREDSPNFKDKQAKKLVDNVILKFKNKFEKKLKKDKLKPENENLSYSIISLIDGFNVEISGSDYNLKKEYNLLHKQYKKTDDTGILNIGLMGMITIGLHFNYYLIEGNKIIKWKKQYK